MFSVIIAITEVNTNMITTFESGSVPVAVAARVYGKDRTWVRQGLIKGWLGIGFATKNGEVIRQVPKTSHGRINYYISPKLLFEQTGYIWRGETK